MFKKLDCIDAYFWSNFGNMSIQKKNMFVNQESEDDKKTTKYLVSGEKMPENDRSLASGNKRKFSQSKKKVQQKSKNHKKILGLYVGYKKNLVHQPC